MTKHFIDKLAFIYVKDHKVLVTLSKGKEIWYIPGGKREGVETDIEALTREVKEELNVELRPETVRHFGTFEAQAHGKEEGTTIRMTCYMGDVKGEMVASSEIAQVDLFEFSQKEKTSLVDHLIFNELKEKDLIW